MTKRLPSGEERELFETALADAKPLKGRTRPRPKAARPATTSATRTTAEPAIAAPPKAPRNVAATGPSGLDGRTAERLRRGLIEPQARLDLHGLTEASAYRTLLTFVKGAHARGLRLVLVVTGKGAKPAAPDAPFDLERDSRTRGVLKAMVPRWLQERELAALVADLRTANRRHGGEGALYVYLRKRVP